MSTMTTVPVVSATWSEIDTDGKSEIVMQNVGSASVLVAVGQSAPQSATAPPEQLATPTISPPADSYTSDQSVTISGPAGATIRYTTDGSTPNAGSPAYSDPIALTVPSVTTVKAYATKAGYADSAVASAAFTLSAAAQSEAYVTWTSGNNVTTSGSYVQCNGSAVHVHL